MGAASDVSELSAKALWSCGSRVGVGELLKPWQGRLMRREVGVLGRSGGDRAAQEGRLRCSIAEVMKCVSIGLELGQPCRRSQRSGESHVKDSVAVNRICVDQAQGLIAIMCNGPFPVGVARARSCVIVVCRWIVNTGAGLSSRRIALTRSRAN